MSSPGVRLLAGVDLEAEDAEKRTFAEILGYARGERVPYADLISRVREVASPRLEVEIPGYGGSESFRRVVGVLVGGIDESGSLTSAVAFSPEDIERALAQASRELSLVGFKGEARLFVTWRSYA